MLEHDAKYSQARKSDFRRAVLLSQLVNFNKFLAVKSINPFRATDLFLYLLKTSENKRFCDICWGHRKRLVA